MKKQTKVIIIFLILIFATCLYFIFTLNKSSDDLNTVYNQENNINNSSNQIETFNLSLLATGDAVIHSGIYKDAYTSPGNYDFNHVLEEITDITSNYDINFINQESPFANAEPSNYPRFNTPTEWGDALINANFNMISLANNHSYDMSSSGVIDTLDYWTKQENIYISGMNYSKEDQNNIIIEEKNGITYAMIAYTEHTNGITVPTDKSYLINVYSKEKALDDISSIKDNVDVVIISIHWGDEYTSTPNEYQKTVAQELADMGADIILGNHPHWIQPIEIIDDTVVVYSMGNFISTQMHIADKYPYTDSVKVGAMVMMDINKTVVNSESTIEINNITVELIYSSYYNNDYKVIPFSKMNSNYDSDYINLYEKHKERITSMSDLVKVNSLN